MVSPPSDIKADALDEQIVRQILCSVDGNAELSQRQLSGELGIALGSVNWYLKRCINKGLIKISQAPLKRYMYYLTPHGFDEKSRLMAQYLRWSFDFFRLGREQSSQTFERCLAQGNKNVILIGDSDLAEIFILSSMDYDVHVGAIFDPDARNDQRLKVPVIKTMEIKDSIDQVLILTALNQQQQICDALAAQGIKTENIIIPGLLNFRLLAKDEK